MIGLFLALFLLFFRFGFLFLKLVRLMGWLEVVGRPLAREPFLFRRV